MEITKTVLSLMLVVVITILTSLTTIAAYAGEGDGNRQKVEDDSSAALADCDDNEVEQAGFDCIALATNDVEIETEPPEEEPPETATLSVCKETTFGSGLEAPFTVTGNDPFPTQFLLGNEDCVDVTIGPGEYTVIETEFFSPFTSIRGDCEQDPNNRLRATGVIDAGDTQECIFRNTTD